MDQMIEQGKSLLFELVPSSRSIGGAFTQVVLASAIISIVVGLLLCFFGYKLFRIFAALSGLIAGMAAGSAVVLLMNLEGTTATAVILGSSVLLCILCAVFRRIGAFFLTGVYGMATVAAIQVFFGRSAEIVVLIGAGIITVLAVLVAIFLTPMIMTVTGIAGGLMAGTSLVFLAEQVFGITLQPIVGYAAGGILAILGIWIQFILHSRKVGRHEKVYARKIKEEESRESEIEQARRILEEDGTEEESLEDSQEILLLEGEELEQKTVWSEEEAEEKEGVEGEKKTRKKKAGKEEAGEKESQEEEFVIFDLDD
ncbi:hypothetical protein [Suipraeoptans intestinalis]|uniref:hypothetical protein n=1 Tax=Suipraeoptans intestinalis TaxID=2606628 RepID=UPI0023F4A776|nr:hypothetical protein [Suipraeoptans intestinalis]